MKIPRNRLRTSRTKTIVVSLLLALLSSTLMTLVNAQSSIADVSAPSWWSGDCDVNNNPGSFALGASYNGVKACGPRPNNTTQSDHLVHFTDSNGSQVGAGEFEWECVELVMRYMYQVYGIAPYVVTNSDAYNVVNDYPGTVLDKTANNGASVPIPGDILAFAASTNHPTYGHTAVVTGVSVDASGTGTVTYMQQNASANGWGSVSATNKTLGDGITGWLHNKTNAATSPTPNLHIIQHNNTASGMTEVKVLSAATNYTSWIGGWTTPDGLHSGSDVNYVVGDYNHDGSPDVYVVQHNNTASGMTEVKVLNGATNFTTWIGGWVTPDGLHSGSDVDYALGDYNHDGTLDLYVIQHNNTASGMTEVKVLNGATNFTSWIGGWTTPDGWHGGSDVNYAVADYNHDGTPDVYEILHNNTASGMTEVKVLNGVGNFASWIGGWTTPDGWHSGSDADYAVGDFNHDGNIDVYVVMHNNTASGMTEVKVLNGATNFTTWIGGWVTPDGLHSGSDVDYALPS